MARRKQQPSRKRESIEYFELANGGKTAWERTNGLHTRKAAEAATGPATEAGLMQLVIAVTGIYVSFLTWAYLQEKLTTTPYGPAESPERWSFPVFLNTVQSVFAATVGLVYLVVSRPRGAPVPPVLPSRRILGPLALVAVTNSLASPFGYASLAHIDYITFLLAKSCKLLPVMFLHITIFRRRFPLYKYLVVAAVTAGVALFTLHSRRKHRAKAHGSGNVGWGLLLLSINLLFDGLTNSTQDFIFQTFRPYSGPQMMCANNLMSSLATGLYLIASPFLVATGVGDWLGMDMAGSAGELSAALAFMARHPAVFKDIVGFAVCGAFGQVFICLFPLPSCLPHLPQPPHAPPLPPSHVAPPCLLTAGSAATVYTLSTFSSVLLVMVNVTRKMFTMILSVVAFGHRLSHMQWLGVGLVFGGIGVEAAIARRDKLVKDVDKQRAAASKKE